MRVATWNIGGGYVKTNSGTYDTCDIGYISYTLKTQDIDILFLQEAHTPCDANIKSQVELIASNIGIDYFAFHPISESHLDKTTQQLSLGIISKYQLGQIEYRKMDKPELTAVGPDGEMWYMFDKGFLIANANFNGRLIRLISGHYYPFHYFKRSAMDNDFSHIREQVDNWLSENSTNTIAGVDMNYPNLSDLIPHTMAYCLRSSFDKTATTPKGEQQDYILHSSEWITKKYHIIEGRMDHFLCIADLK